MSLLLPLSSSELRDLFDVADLVNYSALPTYPRAVSGCRASVAGDKRVRSVQSVCIRANGDIWLIRVGKRGAVKRLWNFGNPLGGH